METSNRTQNLIKRSFTVTDLLCCTSTNRSSFVLFPLLEPKTEIQKVEIIVSTTFVTRESLPQLN